MSVRLAKQYVRLIGDHIVAGHGSRDEWLARHGVTGAEFEHPDFSTDLGTFQRLTLDAIAMTREPALGLVIGEQLGVHAHGALGYAAVHCGTISEVLALIEQFLAMRIGLVKLLTKVTVDHVDVRVSESVPLGPVHATVIEAVVCSIKNLLGDVSLGACVVGSVHFAFSAPSYASFANELLGQPVLYESRFSGLRLPREMMNLPLRMADPKALETAEDLCRRELEQLQSNRSTTARVQRILIERRLHLPTLPTAARLLHVTPRTLHRRLASEGTSYRALLDELRLTLARDYLVSGKASVDEVSYRLGYSDSANFRRAFKRWTGMTPSGYRKAHS